MAAAGRLFLVLVCPLACTQAGCVPLLPLPAPPPQIAPPEHAPPPAADPPQPPPQPTPSAGLPGSNVAWRPAPPLRRAPAGLGPFLTDVESRLPPEMGTRYRDSSRIT